MNFEGFQDLVSRLVQEWHRIAKKEIAEIDLVNAYLSDSPFQAKQTKENELAYEKLMDVRMRLYV